MTEYYEIAKNFLGKNNWVNTIVLIVMAFSFNNKLNKLLIRDGINEVRIASLEDELMAYRSSYNACNKTLAMLKYNMQAHLGDAYIREEDELD